MRTWSKFGAILAALGFSALVALPVAAQRREDYRPPRPAPSQAPRQAPRAVRQQRPPRMNPPNARNDRPQRGTPNIAPGGGGAGPGTQPPRNYPIPRGISPQLQERLSNMPPDARERFLQNNEKFRSMPPEQQRRILNRFQRWDRLTPEQKQRVIQNENIWRELTPGQRQHLRNDILPKWEQMSPQRRQAIQQRLSILQNMPEDARNRRLGDPNFTRGMSEEDRAMLRDLSHTHIGAPDRPPNQ